ncbi:unnamed protein product [Pseudo-nitzschia multistriata]|uniref:SAM-dependent MTase RsmB/NOP-type domain-containing protein n=1 Tax=Pseudo-nitzschia multistriata TaxID=183589 RepID=A0A448ZL90_9STRA|nr:unnamed protein product [Pseudo-nitzschia multistriata]
MKDYVACLPTHRLLIFIAVFCFVILDQCNGLSGKTNLNATPEASRQITHRASAIFALMESMKRKNKFAIRVLEQDPSFLDLDQKDRAFARLLLSTAERRLGQIDIVIESFQRKEKKKNSKPRLSEILVEAALRIGAAQLLFMDVPKYAAIYETVESLRLHPKIKVPKSQISFANAVLRNIDREGIPVLKTTSSINNLDLWLAKQWVKQYGKDTTETIVEAAMSQSPVFITVNHAIQDDGEYDDDSSMANSAIYQDRVIERLEQIRDIFSASDDKGDLLPAELLPVGSIRIPDNLGGVVSKWPLYDEGAWWVQDVSATLPAIALFNSLSSKHEEQHVQDMHVVDLCSAPGGKTAQLCSMGFGSVDAIELSAKRSRSLRQNLKRLGMEEICNVVVEDGREYEPDAMSGPVRGILVDAPCSATGVGSRRPDVLRKSIDITELSAIQRELLVHAADNILEVGGVLVYATCSLLKQEGEDQINWLLSEVGSNASNAQLETIPFAPGEIPGFDDCIDENGWLRVIPGVLPGSLKFCDGFFVARLVKVSK